METLFYLGIIFVLGAMTGWLSLKLHIPGVVGYLVLGLIIGPEVLNFIPKEFVDNSHIITDICLSIIAVLIGATLKSSTLKGHGKEVFNITIFQSLATFIIVTIGFILMGSIFDFASDKIFMIALVLGSIATATAPGTPLAIVNELNAKGKFTSIFLAIVAIDDAVALIFFTLAITIGVSLVDGGFFEWMNIVDSIVLIVFSILLGSVAGVLNSGFEKLLVRHKGLETISTLGLIFLVYSLSEYWKLEPLLSAMAMGVVMTNTSKSFDIVEDEIDNHLTKMIFMLFFIISAMHLKLGAMFSIPIAIGLYIVFRFFGKVLGTYIGAVISNSSSNVKKYMGIALIPQAGVAIGLALSLQVHQGFESIAPIILNIVIATTLIQELLGPFMTKYSIEKSGEINKK